MKIGEVSYNHATKGSLNSDKGCAKGCFENTKLKIRHKDVNEEVQITRGACIVYPHQRFGDCKKCQYTDSKEFIITYERKEDVK